MTSANPSAMRSETDMVAYALEVDPGLLPWIPELLADFAELGANTTLILRTLEGLDLPNTARVVDLGCGKGAVAVAVARAFGWQVTGIDLFEPFLDDARRRAAAASVAHLCRFERGDILKRAGQTAPADIAVFAALGDVLGPLPDTIGVIRRFVRPGGFMAICDGFLRDEGTSDFQGFEYATSRLETRTNLQAHGDRLVREVQAADDQTEVYAREAAQIRRRAEMLAERVPSLKADLMRYAEDQRQEYAYMADNVIAAVWLLERGE